MFLKQQQNDGDEKIGWNVWKCRKEHFLEKEIKKRNLVIKREQKITWNNGKNLENNAYNWN